MQACEVLSFIRCLFSKEDTYGMTQEGRKKQSQQRHRRVGERLKHQSASLKTQTPDGTSDGWETVFLFSSLLFLFLTQNERTLKKNLKMEKDLTFEKKQTSIN